MYTIKNIKDQIEVCRTQLKEVGYSIGSIRGIEYLLGLNRAYGKCGMCDVGELTVFNLYFNKEYMKYCSKEEFEEVIMHECIHTVKGCFNHGKTFHHIASLVNYKYGYNIKTKCSIDENKEYSARVKELKEKKYSTTYRITCCGCNKTFDLYRKNKFINSLLRIRGLNNLDSKEKITVPFICTTCKSKEFILEIIHNK